MLLRKMPAAYLDSRHGLRYSKRAMDTEASSGRHAIIRAEVDPSARLSSSSSLPETPASHVLRRQLRACYGVQESPLKRRTSGWRPFTDDTAKDLSSQGGLPPRKYPDIVLDCGDATSACSSQMRHLLGCAASLGR